ncbi:MAG: PAS domain-containing protein [Pseudomonadota bacterium]
MLHTETRALFSYWDELRNGRKLPYRAEVDPREMACDARHLFILESLGEGNIRFRLAGTALVDAFGMELRGMSVRAIMKGKARESMTALVEETLAEPGIGYARLTETGDENAVWEMILLPLKSDFGKADRIIGALHRIEAVEDTGGPANLHFEIKEMTIRPVTATRAEERRFETPNLPAKRAGGFAEQSAGFEGPARLKAIEGGRSAEEQSDRPVKDRPKLRIITNDD